MRIRLNRTEDCERGSLAAAMAVILVLSLLGGLITARAIGGAFISVGHQNVAAAVSQADAGLADALYRLDQGAVGTGYSTAFCVKAGDSKCLASSIPSAPGDSYVATQLSATDWRVDSMATVNGQTAAVQGEVTDTPSYPFVLFGKRSLNFNGFASEAFSTYDPSMPVGSSNPNTSGDVSIGSDGSITCNGGLGTNVAVVYYGTGGVSSTGSSACGSYQSYPNLYYLATPTAPASALPCPGIAGTITENGKAVSANLVGTGFTGAPSLIIGGTYLCNQPVAMSGVVSVAGQVQLNIILDNTQYDSSTQALIIVGNSYINDPYDACLASAITDCHPTPDLPNSQNLEILSNTIGTVGNDNGQGYDLGAVLYAPDASLTEDGCKSHYYGTVVISALTCNGGPNLYVSYDSTLTTVYGPWTPGVYTQINPATFNSAMAAHGF